jgi:hypothetical protein
VQVPEPYKIVQTARNNQNNLSSLDIDNLNVQLNSEAHGLKTRPMFKKYSSVTPKT